MSHQLEQLEAKVLAALGLVYDPCSVAAASPLSIVDMGLLVDWSEQDGQLHVQLCQTFAGCTMAPKFMAAAEVELAKIPGISKVHVELDPAFFWTPDRMTETGKATMEERRNRFSKRNMPRPRQWQENAVEAYA